MTKITVFDPVKISVTVAKGKYIDGFHEFDNLRDAMNFISNLPEDQQWEIDLHMKATKEYDNHFVRDEYNGTVSFKHPDYHGCFYD